LGAPHTLFVSGSFRGRAAFRHALRLGHRPLLLTEARHLGAAWERDVLADVLAVATFDDLATVMGAARWLARKANVTHVIAIDDGGVDLAAEIREDLQLPGLGVTVARRFRDKLRMRNAARAAGIAVPAFVHALNEEAVEAFLARERGPWLVKPRSQASSRGIVRAETADELRAILESLGDARATHLVEAFVAGDVFHVDAIVEGGHVTFAEVHQYRKPLLEVATSGDMMITSTAARGSRIDEEVRAVHARVIAALGLVRGVTHTEVIVGPDGVPVFLESAARVGGASIPALVEATTGVDLWRAHVELELRDGAPSLPDAPLAYGALLAGLSREAAPSFDAFRGPHVAAAFSDAPHEATVVVRADTLAELEGHVARCEADFRREIIGPA
jgi:hypothetical protein